MKNIWKKLAAVALAITLTAVPMNFTDFTADNSTAIVANAEEQSVTITTVSGKTSYEKDGIKITGGPCDVDGLAVWISIEGEGKIQISTEDSNLNITKVVMNCSYFNNHADYVKSNPDNLIVSAGDKTFVENTFTVENINAPTFTVSPLSVDVDYQFNSFTVYYGSSVGETKTLEELFKNDKTCSKKDLTKEVTITEENDKKIYTIGDKTYTLNKLKKMAFHDYAYRIVEYVEPTEDSDGYYVREKYCKTCGEGIGRNTVKILK